MNIVVDTKSPVYTKKFLDDFVKKVDNIFGLLPNEYSFRFEKDKKQARIMIQSLLKSQKIAKELSKRIKIKPI